jgi:hypothetical protein
MLLTLFQKFNQSLLAFLSNLEKPASVVSVLSDIIADVILEVFSTRITA